MLSSKSGAGMDGTHWGQSLTCTSSSAENSERQVICPSPTHRIIMKETEKLQLTSLCKKREKGRHEQSLIYSNSEKSSLAHVPISLTPSRECSLIKAQFCFLGMVLLSSWFHPLGSGSESFFLFHKNGPCLQLCASKPASCLNGS